MKELSQNNLFLLLQFIVIGSCSSVKVYKKSLPKTLPQTCLKTQISLASNSIATALSNSIHSK